MVQSRDKERGPVDQMMTEVERQKRLCRPEQEKVATAASDSDSLLEPERWVQEHGDVLFGFAALRVRDPATAQDLVQETFLAAIKAKDRFAGRSSERAWLFGILRNKLVDYYRLQGREVPLADLEAPLPEEQGAFAVSGAGKDGWVKGLAPKAWETPEEILVSKEFQEVLKGCLSRLPGKIAQVFLLREIDGVTSDEICKDLGVSPNNVWVMLHRARMGLRRCLEAHWFEIGRKDNEQGRRKREPSVGSKGLIC
jgi:RNA polymerase sigma-70 factor (ECF subfamily)